MDTEPTDFSFLQGNGDINRGLYQWVEGFAVVLNLNFHERLSKDTADQDGPWFHILVAVSEDVGQVLFEGKLNAPADRLGQIMASAKFLDQIMNALQFGAIIG